MLCCAVLRRQLLQGLLGGCTAGSTLLVATGISEPGRHVISAALITAFGSVALQVDVAGGLEDDTAPDRDGVVGESLVVAAQQRDVDCRGDSVFPFSFQ